MFRKVASKAGLVGFALVCGASAAELAACSSSGGSSGSTSTGTAGATGHGGATGTAGATTGTAGAATGTAGAATGTAGAATGTAGAGGASATGPFACTAPPMATCNTWTTFGATGANSFGSGTFLGGITTFGTTLMRDTSTDNIHVTGTVDSYSYGFGLYFQNCVDLSAYTGVSFKIKGTYAAAGAGGTAGAGAGGAGGAAAATINFQFETNVDYPWMPRPMDKKGACTATVDPTNPFGECTAPNAAVMLTASDSTPTAITFASLMGGKPTVTADPAQVVGIQWSFPWTGTAAGNYTFDVTLSDFTLTGGTAGPVSCAVAAGGTGGTGGAGGAGAGGAGTAGAGGATAAGAGGAATAGAGGAATAGAGGAHGGAGGSGG
jgi:hypothetical protein